MLLVAMNHLTVLHSWDRTDVRVLLATVYTVCVVCVEGQKPIPGSLLNSKYTIWTKVLGCPFLVNIYFSHFNQNKYYCYTIQYRFTSFCLHSNKGSS